jgi:uncharacterized repeat protein (TIGR01451 family)
MSLRRKWRNPLCALVAAACAVVAPGCASWQGPRIDPSGERILIWPGQTPTTPPPVLAPPPVGAPPSFTPGTTFPPPPGTIVTPPPVITTPPPPPPQIGLPTGNLQAPPAYPDAGLPAAPPPVITVPPAAPPGSPPPVITTPGAAAPALPPPPPIAAAPAVDAQFAFPAPTIAQAGHPLILTTIVTRRTDRAPLAGWTVQYDVAGTSASLGATGNNRVEVPTDATGRASIEISPTTGGVGEALVNVAVVAPPEVSAAASAPAEVGRSTATITWKTGVPGAPAWAPASLGLASAMPAPSLSTSGPPLTGSSPMPAPSLTETPPPTAPYGSTDRAPNRYESTPPPPIADRTPSDRTAPPKTYAPPPKPQSAEKPELIVDARRVGPEQVEVGGFTKFEITVTNRGDALARDILLQVDFDSGLSHPQDTKNSLHVEYDKMRDLAPGDTASVALTFGVREPGRQCHSITVSAVGAASATASGCITGVEARSTAPSALEVTKQGPTRHYVGEVAKFRIVIKNTGEAPVTNIVVLDHYDASFEPRYTDPGREILPDGSFKWKIERLEKGERRTFDVQAACVSPSRSACSMVSVTADGDIRYADEKCVEILPLANVPPAAAGGVTPPPPLPSEDLKVTLRTSANPARVGSPLTLLVFLENLSQQPQRDVTLQILLPKETTPNAAQIVPPGAEVIGQLEVRFANVGTINPGEQRQFQISLNANSPGVITFVAQISVAGKTQPIVKESTPIQIEPAAQ